MVSSQTMRCMDFFGMHTRGFLADVTTIITMGLKTFVFGNTVKITDEKSLMPFGLLPMK